MQLNIKVCSQLLQHGGLTGNYHAICHNSYNVPLVFMVKRNLSIHFKKEIILTLKRYQQKNILDNLNDYKDGLTIIRSAQCPYTEKNVNAIIESAEQKFKLIVKLIDLKDSASAQKNHVLSEHFVSFIRVR